MPKKSKKTEVESFEEHIATSLAGCPFTNFGPCKTARCVFYAITNLKTGDRECMIRGTYMNSRINLLLQVESVVNRLTQAETEILGIRIAESYIACLQNLDGLLAHPKTDLSMKSKIEAVKLALRKALKTFVEPL